MDSEPSRKSGSRPGRSLRSNFIWIFVGNVTFALTRWGLVVLLARFGGPATVGRYSLALAITAPVILLTNLGLRAVLSTDSRQDSPFRDYWALRLVTTGIAVVAVVALSPLVGSVKATAVVVILVGLTKSIEALSDILYGLFQQREQMNLIGISLITRGFLSLSALGIAIYLTRDLAVALVVMLLTYLVVLAAFDYPKARYVVGHSIRPREAQGTALRQLAVLAAPLGAVSLLGALYGSIPTIAIAARLDESRVGVFAAMLFLVRLGSVVATSIGSATVPRLAILFSQGKVAAFRHLLARLLLLVGALGISGIALSWRVGQRLLSIVYSAQFARDADVLVVLALAGALLFVFGILGTGLTSMRVFRIQTVVQTARVLLLVVGVLVITGTHGLYGVAWVLVAVNALGALAYGVVVTRSLRLRNAQLVVPNTAP